MSVVDSSALHVRPGRAYPLGSAVRAAGVRFAVVSRHATRVWLALFSRIEDTTPSVEIEYDAAKHRTGDIWSIFVEGVSAGCFYMYRMDGPFKPEEGHRYNPNVYLLDPYARVIVGNTEDGTLKCVAVGDKPDWVDDVRPRVPLNDLVIYETHVKGLTYHESSGVKHRGTYLGVIEKIPYFKSLGVTAVEFLPLQEFGETRVGRKHAITGDEIRSYWGYDSIGFFAPCGRYGTAGGLSEQLDEFRCMVTALHEAGIEIILDVVFNHTSERDERGATLSFRGIDNVIYYMLDDHGKYRNFSGCGNTLNCNHPLVRDFILDCLRYWATVMHVDGFRFDLASILGRDTKGHIVENAVLIERIAEDPALRDTKLIAEAWDAAGAYQVGSFGDVRWAEWNGRYRDDVRRYWLGEYGTKGAFATRFSGSADLYQWAGRTPGHSINFITAHDGFTLRDLVSYNAKHNEANGEDNCDGSNDNLSWNYGIEGETGDPAINALRLRMQKNFIGTLFLSLGIPMLLGGDEFGRTQGGNNNPYCQDNEISWIDWSFLERNKNLFKFTQGILRFRRENPALRRLSFFDGQPAANGGEPDVAWFNERGGPADWNDPGVLLACRIDGSANAGTTLYIMFNPLMKPAKFDTPPGAWKVRINTGSMSHIGIQEASKSYAIDRPVGLLLEAKSLIVLTADGNPDIDV